MILTSDVIAGVYGFLSFLKADLLINVEGFKAEV